MRCEVADFRHLHGPIGLPHQLVAFEFMDNRLWSRPLTFSAACPEDVDACLVLRPRDQIKTEYAVVRNEALRNQMQPGGPVHLELGHGTRPLIPSGQEQPRIVPDVIVMVMAEEGVGDLCCADAEFEQSMMRAEAMVEHDVFAIHLHQVSRAHAVQ